MWCVHTNSHGLVLFAYTGDVFPRNAPPSFPALPRLTGAVPDFSKCSLLQNLQVRYKEERTIPHRTGEE